MAKSENQKQKLLFLRDLLLEKTDDEHKLTMSQIIKELDDAGIVAERKSIYSDLQVLAASGLDIIGEREGRGYVYYIGSREFEFAEVKLLVDLVQSSRFITSKKSKELIKKIETLCSAPMANRLQRQVYVQGRIKSENESIYYNVDKLYTAINDDVKITFQYFQWDEKGGKELRHDGKKYVVSPIAVSCDNQYYYMIAYESEHEQIRHYRVDKMLHINVTTQAREQPKVPIQLANYEKKVFNMFGGEEQSVRIRVDRSMIGVMVDRFGNDLHFRKVGDNLFEFRVAVQVSAQFYGWIISLGDKVTIAGPESVVEGMKLEAKRLVEQYAVAD